MKDNKNYFKILIIIVFNVCINMIEYFCLNIGLDILCLEVLYINFIINIK